MATTVTLRYDLVLWLATGALAFLFALYPLSATLSVGGTYVPADADSFYHAQRILAAVASPAQLYQFDPRLHAPEGSWVSWPWAYDTIMALIAHIAVGLFGVRNPLSVLVYVAPLWTFINAALLLGITAKLSLSLPVKAIAMLCYALSPLTQSLHRVGMLDHHYVEYSFVLGTLLLGLGWFEDIDDPRRAGALGVLLGIAPAFHDGLFIMQLPVLATLGLRWLLGRPRAPLATTAFAGSLLLATLLFLLPSRPFRELMFSFGLHSWFHLYIAVCTATLALELAKLPTSKGAFAIIAASGAVLSIVILNEAIRGGLFLSGQFAGLDEMAEVEGIAGYISDGKFQFLTATYSALLWVAPLAVAGLFRHLKYRARDSDLFFLVMTSMGLLLMLQQYRLENYGSFALYLPLCYLVEWARRRWQPYARVLLAGVGAMVGAAYAPAYGSLTEKIPLGGNYDYEMTRAIYPALAEACQKAAGAVLADNADGHFITYHTKCSVIADDFIMSADDERKLVEARHLIQSSLSSVMREAPYVRYIYVRRNDNVFASSCGATCPENKGLRRELLFADPPFPPPLKLLSEVRVQIGSGSSEPLARAFEIVRAEPAMN